MFKFRFLRGKEPICWVTAKRISIPIEELSRNHLINIIDCFLGHGRSRIPEIHEGKTHQEWYDILQAEVERRNKL